MSSFTGVSSIRNVQWKFQKNLQESILLILKTQYIFEFSGLFHCSVIKVLCCRFCVSDKHYIKSLWCCQHFFNFLFCFFIASTDTILSNPFDFVNTFFHFLQKSFSGFCYHAKNQLSCVSSANWQTEKEGFEPSRRY